MICARPNTYKRRLNEEEPIKKSNIYGISYSIWVGGGEKNDCSVVSRRAKKERRKSITRKVYVIRIDIGLYQVFVLLFLSSSHSISVFLSGILYFPNINLRFSYLTPKTRAIRYLIILLLPPTSPLIAAFLLV